jgi:hypothetical protein
MKRDSRSLKYFVNMVTVLDTQERLVTSTYLKVLRTEDTTRLVSLSMNVLAPQPVVGRKTKLGRSKSRPTLLFAGLKVS